MMIWWSRRPLQVELQCFAALDNGLEVQTSHFVDTFEGDIRALAAETVNH